MSDLVVRSIGKIVSGDLERPTVAGDTILIRDGTIAKIGFESEREVGFGTVRADPSARTIDAGGATVFPGLIDSHVHVALGDYTPRQRTLDFIDSCLHGGVTSMISAGEAHVPGRPTDRAGTKALAILAAKSYRNARPSGVKVTGGALLLEPGLLEEDFAELAAEGVKVVGEIGISGVHTPEEAARMAGWAQAAGMRVLVHTGGASIPGSTVIGADFVLAVKPDVAAHVNGGPTAPPIEDVERILVESSAAIELVQCGNVKALRDVVQLAAAHQALDRVIVGTDTPSGTGVIPLGMLRTIAWIAALGEVEPAAAVAMASGNTAAVHGLQEGRIAPGAPADLLIVDAPRGSQGEDALDALRVGDTPAVVVALIDGEVRFVGSRNTPPPVRTVSVPWMASGGH